MIPLIDHVPLYCGGLQTLHAVRPLDFEAVKVIGIILFAMNGNQQYGLCSRLCPVNSNALIVARRNRELLLPLVQSIDLIDENLKHLTSHRNQTLRPIILRRI